MNTWIALWTDKQIEFPIYAKLILQNQKTYGIYL